MQLPQGVTLGLEGIFRCHLKVIQNGTSELEVNLNNLSADEVHSIVDNLQRVVLELNEMLVSQQNDPHLAPEGIMQGSESVFRTTFAKLKDNASALEANLNNLSPSETRWEVIILATAVSQLQKLLSPMQE